MKDFRNPFLIYYTFLESISEGYKTTNELLKNANLNTGRLSSMRAKLLQLEMITISEKKNTIEYSLTNKGRNFMVAIKEFALHDFE